MTQITSRNGGQVSPSLFAENVALALNGTTSTVLLDIPTLELERLGFEFDLTTQALSAFLVEGRFHPDDSYHTITNAVTATPAGLILAASGTLASQAAGSSGWFIMDVGGLYDVRVSATAAVSGAVVTARACGS
ncbi:MAG: hypothetical protein ACYDBH_00415 [Acidobacteriaceae bacterium]